MWHFLRNDFYTRHLFVVAYAILSKTKVGEDIFGCFDLRQSFLSDM